MPARRFGIRTASAARRRHIRHLYSLKVQSPFDEWSGDELAVKIVDPTFKAIHQCFRRCRVKECIATMMLELNLHPNRRKVMGFIGWIVLGLIAGAIAKAIKPGDQGGGWLATLLLGIVGAVLGGWIGSAIFGVGINEFWSLSTWLLAIGGALVVLIIWGLLTRKRA